MPIDTPGWVRDAVFYQIFPDRFAKSPMVPKPGPLESWDSPPTIHGFKGGDLIGIVERLDEIVDLGATALYLTPVFSSASNHRYQTYDYHEVDPILGGTPAMRRLLDAVHERGMRIILDGVFNHCGRGFWPFHHVLENGAASPYRDWFHLDAAVLAGERQLNAYPDRGGSQASPAPLGYEGWWGLPGLPKFNTDVPAVRDYLLGVAERWLRFGIDGWRLDVPAEIDDESFWQEFRQRCRAVNPEAYLVGEIWDEAPEWLRGDRFDALMNYPLGTSILGFVGDRNLDQSLIGQHDSYRRMVHPLDGPAFTGRVEHLMSAYDPDVVAVQLNLLGSHDTPRAISVLNGNRVAFRLGTLLQLTLPGAPCIYYGDELGMEGGLDPDCRRAFPREADAGDGWLRTFFREAVAARQAHVALRQGTIRTLAATADAVAFLRQAGDRTAVVAVNRGSDPVRLPVEFPARDYRPLALAGLEVGRLDRPGAQPRGDEPGRTLITLPPQGALVLIDE